MLQSKCQDKEIPMLIQFSFLKTRILCFLQELFLFIIFQVFENCPDRGVEFLAVHTLFWFFSFLPFVLCFFRTFVCLVAGLLAFEAPSFFHQLCSFVKCQSVDVHCIRIPFLSGEIESWCWFLWNVLPCPFYCSLRLVVLVVQSDGPGVPVVESF